MPNTVLPESDSHKTVIRHMKMRACRRARERHRIFQFTHAVRREKWRLLIDRYARWREIIFRLTTPASSRHTSLLARHATNALAGQYFRDVTPTLGSRSA